MLLTDSLSGLMEETKALWEPVNKAVNGLFL